MPLFMNLFTFFLISTVILTTHQHHVRDGNQRKEWYAQKDEHNSTNYIELITNGDTVGGFFYGVERLPDRTHIYYKAPLDSIKLGGQEFRFLLKSYEFSRQAFDRNAPNTLM